MREREKMMEVHEDRFSRRGEGDKPHLFSFPAHFSSRPHPSSLPGEGLNFFGFAEKVLYAPQLPGRSSPWVGAVRRDEREGEERGKSEPFSFSKTQHFTFVVKPHPKVLKICLVFKRNHEDIEFSIKMKMVKGANHLVHRMEGG